MRPPSWPTDTAIPATTCATCSRPASRSVDWWRDAPNYHGHDIAFTPTRSTGTAILDPDTGGASPANFYRSIVGNVNVMTHQVVGVKLPPGVRGAPGVVVIGAHEDGDAAAATTFRATSTTTRNRTSTLPRR